jgi:PAS domain S-box-containing protein
MQKTAKELTQENEELRVRIEELQETLGAIQRGEVDGLVVSTPKGEQIYSISGAERPYRALIEDMREGAVMLSDDNIVLYCNSGFAKMLKSPMEKIVGTTIESMVCSTYIETLRKQLTSARAHKTVVAKEITLQVMDGTLVPTLISVNSLQSDTLNNTFLVVTDLSDHMDAEVKRYTKELELTQIALSESEQRWSTTLASIGDAVIATDLSGKITFMNNVAEELTKWSLNDAFGKPVQVIFKILNEFTRKAIDNPIFKVLEKGMAVGLANHTILVRKDGTEVAVDDSGAPIKNKEGKTTGVVLIFRDISERRKAEEALFKAKKQTEFDKKRLETIFETTPAAVVVLEAPANKISYINKRALQLYGFNSVGLDLEAVIAKVKPKKVDGSTYPLERGPARRALEGYETTNEDMIIERADGQCFPILVSASPIRNIQGKVTGAVIIFQDITERKQMQTKLEEYANNLEKLVEERTKQLQDKERLAAIGATAGMVGHDIRNPLQTIVSDVYLLKSDLLAKPEFKTEDGVKESLESIEKNVDYINKIVADLQDFVKPLNPHAEETDLKLTISDLLSKNGLPENIKVFVDVEVDARKVIVDSTFINRILYNLVTNAVQAMPNGGELTIDAYRKGNDTVLTVKDTGVGIPEKAKDKMFTPLFTTKAKGQGFGLSVIKRLTESLGGTVSFESQEGKGTTFTIRLPPSKEKK